MTPSSRRWSISAGDPPSNPQSNPVIKAVCFDFDGTLAHFTGDFEVFADGLRTDLGLILCELNCFADRLSEALLAGCAVTLVSALSATLEALELRVPDDLEQLAAQAVSDYSRQIRLLPGALELLESLRASGVPLALITNGPADMQRAAIRAVGIEGFFERVLISGDPEVAVRKPHPRIFELACGALETPPAHTLMIGDNLHADLGGALAAGMQAVGVGTTGEAEGVTDLCALTRWLAARL